MSEEEKKAIENLKHIVKHWKPHNEEDELANIEYNSIRIALNLIEKQDKMIDYMADEIRSCHYDIDSEGWSAEYANCTVEEIKENFRKRVEEDGKE